jgi:uncharacterized membrane protein
MSALYHFNAAASEVLELFLESAVPMIAGLAEVIGLFIIVTSLVRATYHYIRTFFFHDRYDFHHEMSSGLTTALEFLMSAEIAKTFLLQNLESVVPLAATFALRALMSLLLHVEMRAQHKTEE